MRYRRARRGYRRPSARRRKTSRRSRVRPIKIGYRF